VEGHILSLAMNEFELTLLDGLPDSQKFSDIEFLQQTPQKRYELFMSAVRSAVKSHLHLPSNESNVDKPTDHKVAYAEEVFSLGLLFMEFIDAIHEGDGLRILRCWQYFLMLFKATNKHKYSIQAVTMLTQYHFLFSERMSSQLIWSRTINIHGRPGKNIPMDLFMEHLNKELKLACSHLSSNISGKAIQRIGMCLRYLSEIKRNYDDNSNIPSEYSHHSLKSSKKDLLTILKQLNDTEVFIEQPGRYHTQFKKFSFGSAVIDMKKFNFKTKYTDTSHLYLLYKTQHQKVVANELSF
jgi:L1 cell adhesion molecule like protein